jgi:hypothetical protein
MSLAMMHFADDASWRAIAGGESSRLIPVPL